MDISVASYAYPRLDTAARSSVATALSGAPARPATFVLTTCLRIEIAVAGDDVALKAAVDELVPLSCPDPIVLTGPAATEHLFRVAAGLESPIVGEVEVLTQFRRAAAETKAAGASGAFLKILESAVAHGRQIREGFVLSPHATLAAVAAQVVGTAPRVAVVGTGDMARSVWTSLAALPAPPEVTIVARPDTAADLTGLERVVPLDRLGGIVSAHEAIVSATAAATRLLADVDFERALSRRSEPLTLVDMAMPPDFVARPGIHYVGIDDLAALAGRSGSPHQLDEAVATAASETHRLATRNPLSGPLIAAMLARADSVVDDTVDRFSGRLGSEADVSILRQAAHTVARTLLDAPIGAVKQADDDELAAALARLYDGS